MTMRTLTLGRAHPQRGITLVELMIAMSLSTLILMGAFHVHATFQYSLHRQDEISRLQQTMKVTRALLERRLRSAGAGMVGTSVASCGGEHQVGPFTLHNNNTLPAPPSVAFGPRDNFENDADEDPDWFEIVSSDRSLNGYLTTQHPLTSVNKKVNKPENFPVGGLIGIKGPNGVCIFMTSKVQNGKIVHLTGSDPLIKCYNSEKQFCRQELLGFNQLPAGTEILNFSSGTFALRIDNTNPRRPLLKMASGVAGGAPALYNWQTVAENVEDMQIGVYVDDSDPPDALGTKWINSRDLTDAELDRVRAVRISLVFRSAREIPGFTSGRRPALEDRPQATTTDGYLRRVVTTTVKLRNMP